jgi:glyceraldehyde 3-phosphate dehydrogenase
MQSTRTVASSVSKVAARAYSSSSKVEARKFFVGGNWKCNGSVQQTQELISMLNQSTLTTDTEVVVCPSQIHVQKVKEGIRGDIAVGAQDVWTQGNGAFTGETSADMLTDMGVQVSIDKELL